MSLHLKYRPNDLLEVFGNEDAILKLNSQLTRTEDRPHVYLFHGPKGCGKTTLARIAAEMVGCKEHDIYEIDVAAKESRGIDGAADLKRGVHFAPMFGSTKAYILDEVHQGTPAYFNALLKVLEDTPKHVYFFLCTTDPQKLLGTVKSRCSQYSVEKLTQKEIIKLLDWVLYEEKKEVEQQALKRISEVCEGTPREALVMLDQIIDLKPEEQLRAIEAAQERERELKELCQALLEGKKWKAVANILKGLKGEPESLRIGVMNYMNTILLGGNQNIALLMEEIRKPCYSRAEFNLSICLALASTK